MPDSNFYTDPEDILTWLEGCHLHKGIDSVKIHDDGSVDVNGSIEIHNKNIKQLPIRFNQVNGEFFIYECDYLESLEGCGVKTDGFTCTRNVKLKNLIGAPRTVKGNLTCIDLPSLTSLEGFPRLVTGEINISNNPSLKQLDHLPEQVSGFNCASCDLYSLKGSPQQVIGTFKCQNNYYLTSLDGLPREIWYGLELSWTKELPLLKVFYVKRLKRIKFYNTNPDAQMIQDIINKYLPLGTGGMMPCAAELIKTGFRNNARL